MKKILGYIFLAVLLTALVVPAQAQDFGLGAYLRGFPIQYKIASITTTNDSTNGFYVPCNMEVLKLEAICSAVSDTINITLSKHNPTTLVNGSTLATAKLLTAGVVAYGTPTTRTLGKLTAGEYYRIVADCGGDLGNTASNACIILWCIW
ncbi:MAG: hypothetical protein IMZ53_12995 [Thermoplasmata archaeon]|nr:hypothetical protein [Thermoplasmata archaeon]